MSKRKVSTDALETLGTIIDANQKRDAIHLAVEPVEAGEKLYPGTHVYVKDGVAFEETDTEKALGIVDPFIQPYVKKGQRFWFVMYPRMVHSLRHVWTHPAFPDPVEVREVQETVKDVPKEVPSVIASRAWIENYASTIKRTSGYGEYQKGKPITYEELMGAALTGDYINLGTNEGVQLDPEFWTHLEIVIGKEWPEEKRNLYFSCAC